MKEFPVPIVILAFNRPERTQLVFERVRQLRPTQLLVVADGPRASKPDDNEKCSAVRSIFDRIDWDCDVKREFADQNMGSRRRVSTGISWAFSTVSEAIILEDDCVPTDDFFPFCQDLLSRYRDDERIMHIGGTNLAPRTQRTNASYLFSRHALSWGWATWKRAWEHYDHELINWPAVRDGGWLRDYLGDDAAAIDKWTERLDAVSRNEFDSWASIWMLSCWLQNGLSIIPVDNQITNIGLGDADATHTSSTRHRGFVQATAPMSFPLIHPEFMIRDSETDRHLSRRPLMIKSYSGFRGRWRQFRQRQKLGASRRVQSSHGR